MLFSVIIPARLASSRLPGKPLQEIAGVPMIVRVAQQALLSEARQVWVATEDEAICRVCRAHSINSLLTRADHHSGTERLAEAVDLLALAETEIIVNVQGDEPFIDPLLINQLAAFLDEDAASVATVAHPLTEAADFFNPHIVKVVCNNQRRALYFSRAPIPYAREAFLAGDFERGAYPSLPQGLPAFRHCGLYAYRVGFLRRYCQLTACPLERFEALEQLRMLAHGIEIAVLPIDTAPPAGVDTAEELARARLYMANRLLSKPTAQA